MQIINILLLLLPLLAVVAADTNFEKFLNNFKNLNDKTETRIEAILNTLQDDVVFKIPKMDHTISEFPSNIDGTFRGKEAVKKYLNAFHHAFQIDLYNRVDAFSNDQHSELFVLQISLTHKVHNLFFYLPTVLHLTKVNLISRVEFTYDTMVMQRAIVGSMIPQQPNQEMGNKVYDGNVLKNVNDMKVLTEAFVKHLNNPTDSFYNKYCDENSVLSFPGGSMLGFVGVYRGDERIKQGFTSYNNEVKLSSSTNETIYLNENTALVHRLETGVDSKTASKFSNVQHYYYLHGFKVATTDPKFRRVFSIVDTVSMAGYITTNSIFHVVFQIVLSVLVLILTITLGLVCIFNIMKSAELKQRRKRDHQRLTQLDTY